MIRKTILNFVIRNETISNGHIHTL